MGNVGEEVLLLNDGDGTFTKSVLSDTGGATQGVAWADYDNDGDLDFSASEGAGTPYVARNDGGGTFAVIPLPGMGLGSYGLGWGDLEGDGDLDLVMVYASGGYDYVLRNDMEAAHSTPTAPSSGLSASFVEYSAVSSSGVLTLEWDDGSDAETSAAVLEYYVRVGTAPGGDQIMSIPDRFKPGGFSGGGSSLYSTRLSGAGQRGLKLSVQRGETYYWSVVTEDGEFFRGLESAEQSFAVPGFNSLLVILPGESSTPGSAPGKTGTPTGFTMTAPETSFTVTVKLIDPAFNTVTAGDMPEVQLDLPLDALATPPAPATLSLGSAVFAVTPRVSLSTYTVAATTTAVSAVSPSSTTSLEFLVAPGPAHHLHFESFPSTVTAGAAFSPTLSAHDMFHNLLSTGPNIYVKTVDLSAESFAPPSRWRGSSQNAGDARDPAPPGTPRKSSTKATRRTPPWSWPRPCRSRATRAESPRIPRYRATAWRVPGGVARASNGRSSCTSGMSPAVTVLKAGSISFTVTVKEVSGAVMVKPVGVPVFPGAEPGVELSPGRITSRLLKPGTAKDCSADSNPRKNSPSSVTTDQ
ncbi:FG-GAP-like repeat-containing protein [Elusimicrobiota bacterium]